MASRKQIEAADKKYAQLRKQGYSAQKAFDMSTPMERKRPKKKAPTIDDIFNL